MSSERHLKLNQKVEVTGKGVQGTVAYIGSTMFSQGKWIGIILNEPKGKNNGTVQGKTYFQCKENHGMFVRQSQLTLLDEHGVPLPDQGSVSASPSTPTTPEDFIAKPRSRLSTSRLSLAASRSQGDIAGTGSSASTPQREHSEIPVATKRASFIEKGPKRPGALRAPTTKGSMPVDFAPDAAQTGFVETLKPQYTPGASLVSPGSGVEERLSHLQQQQKIEELQNEVRDLNEKIETLKVKRLKDAEKLKDYDKTKMQLEQLLEFKSRIMETQASLQRDMQRAKQEARDAIEAKNEHAEEMADLAETVEMATLDKEMAEEKAETLQIELETARERIEEMTLDLEILRTQMSEYTSGTPGTGASTFEIKQLEQQNIRLRDTLVKLRDVSAHEKHELQKAQKELDQRQSEISELSRIKQKLSARVEEIEHQIADLQEQVDAALGAEEMVETLATQKLNLEERVVELEETVTDLEALLEVQEQLQESSRETELELREELDLAGAECREIAREREAALETLSDREQTINKFRELVQRLQEQSIELQQRLERESTRPVSALPEILDFKKMFAETKAHTKAIDLELRRLDILQANQHVLYLKSYMPETFMIRGGDHDAILTLLLIPRLHLKTEILLNQLRDKFPEPEKIDRVSVVRGHVVERFAFKSRLALLVHSLQVALRQFQQGMNICTTEQLLLIGAALPEMSAQEKAIDMLVDLAKKDQLDENVPTQSLERCIQYFNSMHPVLLSSTKLHQCHLLNDIFKALNSASDVLKTDAFSLRSLLKPSEESSGEIALLSQHLVTASETLQQQIKTLRRRLPHDIANSSSLGLAEDECAGLLQRTCPIAVRLSATVRQLVRNGLKQLISGGEPDAGLSSDIIRDLLQTSIEMHLDPDGDATGTCLETCKSASGALTGELTRLAGMLGDDELDVVAANALKNQEKITPPILLRAHKVKKDMEEMKNMKHKLENKESDIKELKISIKNKQEELCQMTIRKDLAEKKLANVSKDHEMMLEKQSRKIEDLNNILRIKEKEYERTMDHLQHDIETLESEKGFLKEKLKGKKGLLDTVKTSATASSPIHLPNPSASLNGSGEGPKLGLMVKDSPLLQQEIEDLRAAVRLSRMEASKIKTEAWVEQFRKLKPLNVPTPKQPDPELALLEKEATSCEQELMKHMTSFKIVDLSTYGPDGPNWGDTKRPKRELAAHLAKKVEIGRRLEILNQRVMRYRAKKKLGGHVQADLTVFPTPEMTKAMGSSVPQTVGTLSIPVRNCKEVSSVTSVVFDWNSLRKLHQHLIF